MYRKTVPEFENASINLPYQNNYKTIKLFNTVKELAYHQE